jgi:hypothetical protein
VHRAFVVRFYIRKKKFKIARKANKQKQTKIKPSRIAIAYKSTSWKRLGNSTFFVLGFVYVHPLGS